MAISQFKMDPVSTRGTLSTRTSSTATGSPRQVIQYSGQAQPLPWHSRGLTHRWSTHSIQFILWHEASNYLTKSTSEHNYGNTLHPPSPPACWAQCLNVTSGAAEVLGTVHGRSIIKNVLHNCVKCYRFRQVKTHKLMADLPAFRVNYASEFSHCGVDFAEPFNTKSSVGRSRIVYKTYLALFICLTTKTIHLEIVSELSADTLIATLGRFFARWGYPTKMYSDNGTNFTSTHHKLH